MSASRSRNTIIYSLLLFFTPVWCYGQSKSIVDKPVCIKCASLKKGISVPPIVGYDRVKCTPLKNGLFRLHYASDFVASLDVILQKRNGGFYVKGILFYAPCQTCADARIETITYYGNMPLAYFYEVDILDYVMKEGKKEVFYNRYYNDLFNAFSEKKKLLSGTPCLDSTTSPLHKKHFVK